MADKKISALTAATTPLAGTEVLPVVQSGATVKVSVESVFKTTQPSGVANGIVYLNGTKNATSSSNLTFDGSNFTLTAPSPVLKLARGSANQPEIRFGSATATDFYIQANSASGVMRYDAGPSAAWGGKHAFYVDQTERLRVDANITALASNFVVGTAGKGIDFSANANAPGMTSEVLTWYEEGNWTPSVAATSGTITTLGAVSGTYTRIGRRVFVTFSVAITTNGTGTQAVRVSGLPFAISGFGSGSGRENGVNGYMIQSAGFNGNTYFDLLTASGGYPGGNGYLLQGFIEYNV